MRYKIVCMISIACSMYASDLNNVLLQYQQALSDLIAAHQQMYPKKPIDLSQDAMILRAYQPLIAPSIMWINEYAQVVASQVFNHLDYSKDLSKLFDEYQENLSKVKVYVEMFPTTVQPQALSFFNQAVSASMVQVAINIIEQLAYAYTYDLKDLHNAWTSFQLAMLVVDDLASLPGLKTSEEIQSKLTSDMQSLFQAAIEHGQSLLQQSMVNDDNLVEVYKNLEFYAQVLYQVSLKSGNSVQAYAAKNRILSFQQQQEQYTKAVTLKKAADQSMIGLTSAIVLNVLNPAQLLTDISHNIVQLQKAAAGYQSAAQSYQQAMDLIGQSRAQDKSDMITDFDVVVRFVQKLWALYLVDQSGQGVFSFPTIASYAQVQGQNQTDNVVQALQTLSGMISNVHSADNSMQSLLHTAADINISYLFSEYIVPFLQEHSASSSTINQNPLIDMTLLSAANRALSVVELWSFSLMNALSAQGLKDAANAIAYAQHLDQFFQEHEGLNQYIPHLPDCLHTQSTWQDLTAICLLNAGVVSSEQDALHLGSTVSVTVPQVWSQAQIDMAEKKADDLFVQAEQAQKGQRFVVAAMFYQKAMHEYRSLILQASLARDQIVFAQKANIAQTRFTAMSFAGLIKYVETLSVNGFKNIPEHCIATSYVLTFDPSILNNSLPDCVSSVQDNEPFSVITEQDQQDIISLIKAALVAQKLIDQGEGFSTYFSDYSLNLIRPAVQASSLVGQISQYLNVSRKVKPISVTKNLDGTLAISIANFPLNKIQGVCTTVPSAVEFLTSAAFLMTPSSNPITLSGQVYVSGNDQTTAQFLYEQVANLYVSEAETLIAEMDRTIQQASLKLKGSLKIASNMQSAQNRIKRLALSAQALLSPQVANSAWSYFTKADQSLLAQASEQLFFNLYQMQIDFLQQCLIGNPTSNAYQHAVYAINGLYVAWASQVSDQVQIDTINQAIATLYETAGDKALTFFYEQTEYPGFKQIHYMAVAEYYAAAQKQYELLNNDIKALQLKQKIDDINYKAALQNVNLYFFVKKNGATYISQSKSAINVSCDQLSADYLNAMNTGASIDPNEMSLYSTVQDLLVDAAIVFEQLSATTDKSKDQSKAVGTVNSSHKTVLAWLFKQKMISEKFDNFSQVPLEATSVILHNADGLYKKFYTDIEQLAASSELLFNMVKNQYLMDYLAASSQDSANVLAQKTQEFLSTLQQEALNLSNPPQGYVQ